MAILARHVHVDTLTTEVRAFQGAELLYTSLPAQAIDELEAAFSGS